MHFSKSCLFYALIIVLEVFVGVPPDSKYFYDDHNYVANYKP